MSDDDRIEKMKRAARKKKKEDGAFDGRFVERAVPDKQKERDSRACRGEQEREAIERSKETSPDIEEKSRSEIEDDVQRRLHQEFSVRKAEQLFDEYFDDLYDKYKDADQIVDKIIFEENQEELEDEEPSFNPFAQELDNE